MAFLVGVAATVPVAALTWRVESAAIPYLAASAVLELLYIALLARAYARARASVVYPVARGGAPVLVLLGSAVIAADAPTAAQLLGVVLVTGGVLLVRGGGDARAREVVWGLAVALTIAAYTLVDDHGVRHAGAMPYLAIVLGAPTLAYAGGLAARRGLAPLRAAARPATVLTGLAVPGAFGLFLLALQRAPAAPVAAVRESSILIAAGLSALLLGERLTAPRLAGAAAVTAGVAVLALA